MRRATRSSLKLASAVSRYRLLLREVYCEGMGPSNADKILLIDSHSGLIFSAFDRVS